MQARHFLRSCKAPFSPFRFRVPSSAPFSRLLVPFSPQQSCRRRLCTTPPQQNVPPEGPPQSLTWRDFLTPSGLRNLYHTRKGTLMTYAIIGGIVIAVYYVVRGGFAIADFFVSTNFYDVATISFIAGLTTAGVIAVGLSYARRLFVIKPEVVYKNILQRVQGDPRVAEMLGDNITPGKFRAYALNEGGLQLTAGKDERGTGWSRFWKPRKLQMMFQLQGSRELGMVSFEAKKEFNGDLLFTSLVVDGLKNGEKLILEGDGSNKVYQGIIKLR